MKLTRTLSLSLALSALSQGVFAAPALQAVAADGKVIVRATAGRLAAWRPAANALIVAVPADSGHVEIGQLPAGVQAQKLEQASLNGIVLQGVPNTSWQVVQDGANWVIRPGKGLKSESVLMLKDGWRVSGETFEPQPFTALGKEWAVAPMDQARSVAGSVTGAVRMGGKAAEPAVVNAQASPSGEPQQVVVEPAPGLRPLGQPLMAANTLPARVATVAKEPMQAVQVNTLLARIEPASGPDLETTRALPLATELAAPTGKATAPAVAAAVASATLPVSASSGLAKSEPKMVKVEAGPAMKPIGVSPVVEDLLPKILGDVYKPGTVVSLTLPGEGADAAHEDPHAAAENKGAVDISTVVSMTVPSVSTVSSGTWNQVTLAPFAEEKAAELAAKNAAQAEVTPSKVAWDETPPEDPRDVIAAGTEDGEKGLLPAREGSYTDAISNALQAIAETQEGTPRERDAQLNLAALYLAWQRPEEAMAVLSELPQRADKQPDNPLARLYMAVAQLAMGKLPSPALLDQGGPLGGHAKLWRAVSAEQSGDLATALKIWPQERGILPQYPSYLRERAQLAQANALVAVGDRATAKSVIDQLRKGYKDESKIPVGLTRLAGLVRLGTKDEAQGLELLAKAAEDMRDPAEAYRAKFQFVKALQQRNDLSPEQVRTYLADLWLDWRGDDLERDVLSALADLYDKANEPREALHYWQTLVRAYPKAPEMATITERMTDAFLRVFDPENPKVYDPLEYIGMYYDFSELVPNDGRGDMVQEQVARLLINANLWNRAAPILEQQLRYRPLDLAAQGRLSLMLAEAYANMGRAADGLKMIDKWQHAAQTTELKHEWKVLEARLLLQLNRPEAALKAMAALPADNPDFRDLRISANWKAQDWSASVPLLNAKLQNVTSAQLVSDTSAQLAAFRLAYAYGQQRDGADLTALSKRYEEALHQLPDLADGVSAVAASSGISATTVQSGPLTPLTSAMNQLNQLTDRVQSARDDVAQERKDQQEYNDKMRYMELLPPPAI